MRSDVRQIRIGGVLVPVQVLSKHEVRRIFEPRQVRINTTCLNCDQPMAGAKYPYLFCSDVCKQTAKLVRWARRKKLDGTSDRPDIRVARQVRLGLVLSGGYPERERQVDPEIRDQVLARANGRCQRRHRRFDPIVPDRRPTVQHTRGSSNDPAHLRAFCFACNTLDARSKLRPTADPAKVEMARAIRRRWEADQPTHLCDDPVAWPATWRKIARQRFDTVG